LVLSPSIKERTTNGYFTHVKVFENFLVRDVPREIPIYYSCADSEELCGCDFDGKTRFCTLCGAKGLTAKLVIVFGFDGSYFRWFARNEDPNTCTQAWHVGLTRASEQLIMVEDRVRNGPIPFADYGVPDLERCLEIVEVPSKKKPVVARPRKDSSPMYTVTELLAHQCDADLADAHALLEVNELSSLPPLEGLPMDVPGRVRAGAREEAPRENVSHINGIVMNLCVEYECTGTLQSLLGESPPSFKSFKGLRGYVETRYARALDRLERGWEPQSDESPLEMSDMCFLAVCRLFKDDGLLHPFKQLPEAMDWLDPHKEAILASVRRAFAGTSLTDFEMPIQRGAVRGRCDAMDASGLKMELKFTTLTGREHQLQAGLYDFMGQGADDVDTAAGTLLVNLKTGQRFRVRATENFLRAVGRLVESKMRSVAGRSPEKFKLDHDAVIERWLETPAQKIPVEDAWEIEVPGH
jgi:hypothetical protein